MNPRVQLLLADDDAGMRSLVGSFARDTDELLAVLEAGDGGEAIQLGLQRRPQIALLDVSTPRLGGVEVANTLRELVPEIRLALHTDDPLAHREQARAHGLPLFDKRKFGRIAGWLRWHVRSSARGARRRNLECAACGYGIARPAPPERCPMCQGERTWIHAR